MRKGRLAGYWKWLFSAALLAAVVILAGRYAARGDVIGRLERARPAWLAAAIALQGATYLAQGEIWRVVARASGRRVPLGVAYSLSFAKLFVDQTVPSSGVSGTVVAAKALESRGLPRPAAMACVGINMISYYAAVSLALAAGALGASRHRELLIGAACAFVALGALAALVFGRLSKGRAGRGLLWRIPVVAKALDPLKQADPRLLRAPAPMALCAALQLSVIALDTSSVWVLARSLGVAGSIAAVFASFMLASAVRSVSFLPGGLGPFEASSVWALRVLARMPLGVALSATLLFRFLSFWLPMIPGWFAWRRAYRPEGV